jgi:hypothetical protein
MIAWAPMSTARFASATDMIALEAEGAAPLARSASAVFQSSSGIEQLVDIVADRARLDVPCGDVVLEVGQLEPLAQHIIESQRGWVAKLQDEPG